MYKVIKFFTDLQDNSYKYNVGMTYPRLGYKPSKERVSELLSDKNKRGVPMIAEIPEKTLKEVSTNVKLSKKRTRKTNKE